MKQQDKKRMIQRLSALEAKTTAKLGDAIADMAEPGMEEHRSADLLVAYLAEHGFEVEHPWPGMPTAFRAAWGESGPSIGILAEYDALPNCGPQPGTWGHGCGHNLLGAGAAVGAVLAKAALEKTGTAGRIVLWGCPAEELLVGKVFMARDGAFRENDAVLGWHPGSSSTVGRLGGAALDSVLFEFHGKTAHGASAHNGRSALDGVMLLDVAANYLREHVPENVRIHMCILDGGDAPNVVPAYAKAWYYVRGKDRKQVDEVRTRLLACARGAAMATGTTVKTRRLTGIYSRLTNEPMAKVVARNLRLFGANKPTPGDIKNVEKLGKPPKFNCTVSSKRGTQGRGSSDEDNVSWLSPFGRFCTACTSKEGVPGHHRDLAAQVKLPFAHRGALRAAEVFAGATFDLCAEPELLKKSREEFEKKTRRFEYDPLVTKRQAPPTARP